MAHNVCDMISETREITSCTLDARRLQLVFALWVCTPGAQHAAGQHKAAPPRRLLSVGFTPQSLHNCRQQAQCLSYIIGLVEMMGQDVSQAVFARQVCVDE
jgi:hypothetical protein